MPRPFERLAALFALLLAGTLPAHAQPVTVSIRPMGQAPGEVYAIVPPQSREIPLVRGGNVWTGTFSPKRPVPVRFFVEYGGGGPNPVALNIRLDPAAGPVEIVLPRPNPPRAECHARELPALERTQTSPRELMRAILLADQLLGLKNENPCPPRVLAKVDQHRTRAIAALRGMAPWFLSVGE